MEEQLTLNEWQSRVAEWAIRKGWWNPEGRNPLEMLMLINTETAECAEAFRNGNPPCTKPGCEGITEAEEEMADTIIRMLHFSAEMGWNLERALALKMAYNETRPHRHGGKKY